MMSKVLFFGLITVFLLISNVESSQAAKSPFVTHFGPYQMRIDPIEPYSFYQSTLYFKKKILISDL